MTDSEGENEGIRVLDDFVCQAIPDPSVIKLLTAHNGDGTSGTAQGGTEKDKPEAPETPPDKAAG